jgi:hypothetical protein
MARFTHRAQRRQLRLVRQGQVIVADVIVG